MHRNLRLLRLAAAAELRNPALRLLLVLGFVITAVYAWNNGQAAGNTAVVLANWLGRAYGSAACLWLTYAALRDEAERTRGVMRSKPVDGAAWVALNWGSQILVWLVLLAGAFLGAMLGQLPAAGPISIVAHAVGFIRAASVMVVMSTLAFALTRLMRSPLGGIIILFAWYCAIAGLEFIPIFLRPDNAQNFLLFVSVSAFLLCLAGLLVERWRRGELRRPVPALGICVALLLLAGAGAASAYHAAPGGDPVQKYLSERIGLQDARPNERMPGFWLPDGTGRRVSTYEYRGKIILLFLFAADDLEAARTLPGLERIQHEYGARGVQPIAVCFSTNRGDNWAISRFGGYHFPIAADPGTEKTASPTAAPVAFAYRADALPMLVVADRYRRIRDTQTEPSYDYDALKRMVEERLAEEPR